MSIKDEIQAIQRQTEGIRRCRLELVEELAEIEAKEQEKESCEFCERADFGLFGVKIDKYSASIHLAGGNYIFPKNEQFNFCPVCGRNLKEE